MYLESEVPAIQVGNKNSKDVSTGQSSNATHVSQTVDDDQENEFFSPTTKKVLEEISADHAKALPEVCSTSVKRPLSFNISGTPLFPASSNDEPQLASISEQAPDTTVILSLKNDAASMNNQSPIKKLKNKED